MSENSNIVNESEKKTIKIGRKQLIVTIAVFLAVIAILAVLLAIFENMKAAEELPDYSNVKRFNGEEINWDENIFEDEDYLAKDSSIEYSTGSQTFILFKSEKSAEGLTYVNLEEGNEEIPDSALIFDDYIHSIIMGDREKVNSHYSKSFHEGMKEYADKEEDQRHPLYNSLYNDFTMQRVYDVKITFEGRRLDEATDTVYDQYKLEYKLGYNNCTFIDTQGTDTDGRDVSCPQTIRIISEDGEYRIATVGFTFYEE